MGSFQSPGFTFTAEAIVRINCAGETDSCILLKGDA
jgi:hypothetical protein